MLIGFRLDFDAMAVLIQFARTTVGFVSGKLDSKSDSINAHHAEYADWIWV